MAAPPATDVPPFAGLAHVAVSHEASIKLTRGHSCVLCQQRKVRCDKNKPCANCVKAGVDCKVVPPQPPRRRKKKPQERDLIDRLKKYEALLSQHGVEFEPIGHAFRSSDPASVDEIDDIEHGIEGLKTSPSSTGADTERYPKWFQYARDYKNNDSSLRDSSDESSDGPVIHKAFDKMFDGQDGFPFVIGGSMTSVTDLHPPAVQIFQLWQLYLDNVNPLLKLTHTPTLQGQVIEAAANPSKIPKPFEALLFSIYFISIVSLTNEEVQETFKEDRTRLMSKYHRGAQQALINAGFMRSPDLVVLQAFLLYLIAVRQFVDPRAMFCLIGIAVRVANRLGLHQDAEKFNFPPFEVELRRRLWWQLAIFDKRVAEMTGSSMTALSTNKGDCKWPLNINDTDLHVNAKDRIAPYAGPTEMLFSLTRFELTVAADPEGSRPLQNLGQTPGNKSKFSYSASPASSDMFTNAVHHNLPITDLEGYIKCIEEKYLNHCDSKIPLHLFTFLMTRQAMSKLRIIDYFCRGYLQRYPDPSTLPPGPDRQIREVVFEEAMHVLEYDNMMQTHEALHGFKWYTYMYFPLPALAFLIQDLRYITTGELCERAWDLIFANFIHRKTLDNPRNPVNTALGGMIIKAWDAHEAAETRLGRSLPPPNIINKVRENVIKMKGASKEESPMHKSGLGSSNKGSISTAGGTTSPGEIYGGSARQTQQRPPGEVEIQNPSTSPPIVSGHGGGGIGPIPGAMFGAGGFDGVNQDLFGSSMLQQDLGMVDWSGMTPWGGPFPGASGYEFPQQNMSFQGQGS